MPTLAWDGHTVQMNSEGFLIDSSEWTPELAEVLARRAGIASLTERHWRVLTICREDAARQGRTPGLRRISAVSGVGLQELHRLFPHPAPGALAVRIAGLPGPPFLSHGGTP